MKKMKWKKSLTLTASAALALSLLAGCGAQSAEQSSTESKAVGTVLLSVNPEIEVEYDKSGLVLEIEGLNKDGKTVVKDVKNYQGKDCRTVVNELVREIYADGYFEKTVDGHTKNIVLKLEEGSVYVSDEFLQDVADGIRETVQECGIGAKAMTVSEGDLDDAGHIGQNKAKELVLAQLGLESASFRDHEYELDDGVYEFEDFVDGCGELVPHPINIRVKITVAGDEMTMDFTGTHVQVEAPINVPFPALMSAILFSIKALVGPSLPTNSGIFSPIKVIAPAGCLVNPTEPAPVSVLIDAGQRIPDTLFGALASIMPERILAASNGACTTCMLFGRTEHSHGKYFICHESIAGGSGASHYFDGLSGVQVYLTNTSNMPIEATEIEYPDIMLEQYYLRRDSGGAGQFRGGCGIQREYKICSDGMAVNCLGDRQKFQPWGLDGGMAGAAGAFYLVDGQTGEKTALSHKTSNLPVKKGDSILVLTPGAGGVGAPGNRPPEKVLLDVRQNLVSPEAAKELYGVEVVMGPTGVYELKK